MLQQRTGCVVLFSVYFYFFPRFQRGSKEEKQLAKWQLCDVSGNIFVGEWGASGLLVVGGMSCDGGEGVFAGLKEGLRTMV